MCICASQLPKQNYSTLFNILNDLRRVMENYSTITLLVQCVLKFSTYRNNLGACQKNIFLGLIPEILIQEH